MKIAAAAWAAVTGAKPVIEKRLAEKEESL